MQTNPARTSIRPTEIILLLLSLFVSGCEDFSDCSLPESVPQSVEVTLHIDFAQENRITSGVGSKTNPASVPACTSLTAGSFEAGLTPSAMQTKAAQAFPDKLYNLEIWQYNAGGTKIGGQVLTDTAIEPGSNFTLNLQPTTGDDYCQLIILARGNANAVASLSGCATLSAVQEIKADASVLESIDPEGNDRNAMPYVLHLKAVKITSDGLHIQNPEGNDVRIRLKRLAAKLKVNWVFADAMTQTGYTLKEVKLCQVPKDFRILAKAENTPWGLTYPNVVSEFADAYRLIGASLTNAGGTHTVWIPANVRGVSAAATSPLYRNQANAPDAASYLELVVDNAQKQERLYYRAYLGGEETSDFNLYENTDYDWTIRIGGSNYAADPRIQLLDQSPALSTNFVSTSNCLMIKPGTNICFNPYRHSSGTAGWNDQLSTDGTIQPGKEIGSVKVLWQTKDTGTSGNLVMGYVIDGDNHVNLVNLTDAADPDRARIHVKVPASKGGNALIAAYGQDGTTVLWSWHLWLTDYQPVRLQASIGYAAAQQASQNGTVHQYPSPVFTSGVYAGRVMMDRYIGATAGGFPGKDASLLDFVRRNGYLYEWGRKDPFFGSLDGTTNEQSAIFDGYGQPLKLDIQSYSAAMLLDGTDNTLLYAIRHPLCLIMSMQKGWYQAACSTVYLYLWGNDGDTKTLYDPCPDGWKVPRSEVWNTTYLHINNAYWYDADQQFKAKGSGNAKGGRLYNLTGSNGLPSTQTIHNTAWFPVCAFRTSPGGSLANSATAGYTWSNELDAGGNSLVSKYTNSEIVLRGGATGVPNEPLCVRCVQDGQ